MKTTIDPDVIDKRKFLFLSQHMREVVAMAKEYRKAFVQYNQRFDGLTEASFERLTIGARIDDKFREHIKAAEAVLIELALEYHGLCLDEQRATENNQENEPQ